MPAPPRLSSSRAPATARAAVAQARLLTAVAVVSRTRLFRRAGEAVSAEPRLEDVLVAGTPTMLARPEGRAPRPALVFCNGVTPWGRDHPLVRRLAYALARTGHLVLVPDPPGLARGEISDHTVDAIVAVATAAAERPDCRGARVGLLGVSIGTVLALLAAEHPDLADRTSVVAGIAPYSDLAKIVQLATTGHYPDAGGLVAFPTPPYLPLMIGRSLVAGLPPGPDRELLVSTLAAIDDDDPEPLAPLRVLPQAGLEPSARSLLDVLLNPDPARFDVLYGALPEFVRAGIDRLSPIAGAARLGAPIELVSAPRDRYFPLAESRALARAAPSVRLTITATLSHATPDLSLASLVDLVRLDAFGVRVLRAAQTPSPVR